MVEQWNVFRWRQLQSKGFIMLDDFYCKCVCICLTHFSFRFKPREREREREFTQLICQRFLFIWNDCPVNCSHWEIVSAIVLFVPNHKKHAKSKCWKLKGRNNKAFWLHQSTNRRRWQLSTNCQQWNRRGGERKYNFTLCWLWINVCSIFVVDAEKQFLATHQTRNTSKKRKTF